MTRFGIQNGAGQEYGKVEVVSSSYGRRHRLLTISVTVLALLYAIRLGQLQIVHGEEYVAVRDEQTREFKTLPVTRGRIIDRNGKVLVAHDTRHKVYMDVDALAVGREEALETVAGVVDVAPARHRAALAAKSGQWPLLATRISDEERLTLERNLGAGVGFDSHSARVYPNGHLARRMIGSIDAEGHGRTGLERAFNNLLVGQPGRVEVRRDGLGNLHQLPRGQVIEARPGHTVVLTIDSDLQRIAENELQRAIEQTGAKSGDIVLLDPRTGELLAVASERHETPPGQIPAFVEPYEPGSTVKPFLLASLLNEGLVDLNEIIDVEGGVLTTGRRTIRDVHGYDTLSVREVIAQSSNVGAAKLSQRLSAALQHRYLRDFGFGMRTQIGHLAESSGRLTRPESWTSVSAASHAIGYEISTSSLQLVAAYGALANDGVLMQPMLVKEIQDESGQVVEQFEPREVRRVVSAEVATALVDVLAEVVSDGTGSLAQMASFAVAGKTGTARLAEGGSYALGRYRALFVGFAPADDPSVAILTRLEDPSGEAYYGGAIAAPTSQATLQAALATHGVEIDPGLLVSNARPFKWDGRKVSETHEPTVIFATDVKDQIKKLRTVPLPDLTGLSARSAVARLHELGFRVEWKGSEVVTAQIPSAGSWLTEGDKVVLK